MLSTPAQHTSGEFCDSLKSCFSEDRCCLGGSTARTAHRNCGPVLHDFRNYRCKIAQRNGNRARRIRPRGPSYSLTSAHRSPEPRAHVPGPNGVALPRCPQMYKFSGAHVGILLGTSPAFRRPRVSFRSPIATRRGRAERLQRINNNLDPLAEADVVIHGEREAALFPLSR